MTSTNQIRTLLALAFVASLVTATRSHAQLTITASPTAPSVDGADIANLMSPIANDFQSSFIWPDRPARGQSFLTGNSAGDFTLDAITVQASELALPTNNYTLRLGSVSGTSFSTIATLNGSFGSNINANDYVTFALNSPVSLSANTNYGFDVALAGTDGGFQDHGWQLRNSAQSGYADGSAYSSGANAVGGASFSTHNQDRIFHLNLSEGALPPPPTPVAILSTDFTGRTVAGDTASNITWITNGVGDPGDLTAVPVGGGTFGGLFDTANAQGHFAPDRNTNNEGPWSTDIALTVESGKQVLPPLVETIQDWTR